MRYMLLYREPPLVTSRMTKGALPLGTLLS
jgi:hypothetical protein